MDSKRSRLAWLVSKAPDGFKGVSRCFGGDFGLKGAENGLERFEQSPIRQQLSYACFGGLYGSRRTSNGSVAAMNVTDAEIHEAMRNSVSCTDLEGSEWPRGVVVDKLIVNDPCVINHGTIL
jgi:hypothetical protein